MRFIIILVIVSYSLFVKSQTLVNTEKMAFLDGKDYLIGAELGYEGSFGNSDIQQFSSIFILGYKLNNHHLLRVMGGFEFLSEDKKELTNIAFTQFRYNYIFSSKIRTFHFYQIQYNKVILLNRRDLYGSGIRLSFFKNDSSKVKVNIGIGLMYEEEQLDPHLIGADDISHTELFRMANFISVRYKTTKNIEFLSAINK
jgi:hypothetical protein